MGGALPYFLAGVQAVSRAISLMTTVFALKAMVQ